MAIASSPTRDKFPLSPKKIIKKTLTSTIGWIILLLIACGIASFFVVAVPGLSGLIGLVVLVCFGLLALIVVINYLYQRWYFDVYFYDLTSDYIIIKKGPITPREITIPYERVQDVYVDQDIFDRAFGLYDVHLSSATATSGMEAHIDGVEKNAADGLRAFLLQTVSSKISRGAGKVGLSDAKKTS